MIFTLLKAIRFNAIIIGGILTQPLFAYSANVNTINEINPKITGTTTVCKGGSTVLEVSIKEGNEYASFQWQVSEDNIHFIDIEGATNKNFTTPILTHTTYYRVSVLGGETGIVENSEVLPITVIAPPSVQVVPEDKSEQAITLKAILNGGVNCTIQWQSSDKEGENWEDLENETAEILKVSASKMTKNTYRAIAKCKGNGCCN